MISCTEALFFSSVLLPLWEGQILLSWEESWALLPHPASYKNCHQPGLCKPAVLVASSREQRYSKILQGHPVCIECKILLYHSFVNLTWTYLHIWEINILVSLQLPFEINYYRNPFMTEGKLISIHKDSGFSPLYKVKRQYSHFLKKYMDYPPGYVFYHISSTHMHKYNFHNLNMKCFFICRKME